MFMHVRSREHNRISKRIFRDRTNPLDFLDDRRIVRDYRLDRQAIFEICGEVEEQNTRPTKRSCSMPVSLQVMIALRYYASGSYLSVIGDAHGVGKMSASRCLHQISAYFAENAHRFIKFPMGQEEQFSVKKVFFYIKQFPQVLGAVDGTLIPIKAPSFDEHVYVCRKGYHALNIQCVCDAENRFLNVVAKWPGSTHDAHIWNTCSLSDAFESSAIENGWLLGDSAYGLKPWLLTPKLSPETAADRKYNVCHRSTRSVIERTYGIWKMRFRCLYKKMTFTPDKNINIILSTAVLHNRCVDRRIPLDDSNLDPEERDNELNIDENLSVDSADGRIQRNHIIENVFANM